MQVQLHLGADAVSVLAEAGQFVGVPYRLGGRSPAGWDCWGCVAHVRQALFGKVTPSWAETYSPLDGANPVRLADVVERLIRERLDAWSPCPPRPGAVALFSLYGRPAHVGLMLDGVVMLHALGGCETALERIDGPRWASRLIGCFDA